MGSDFLKGQILIALPTRPFLCSHTFIESESLTAIAHTSLGIKDLRSSLVPRKTLVWDTGKEAAKKRSLISVSKAQRLCHGEGSRLSRCSAEGLDRSQGSPTDRSTKGCLFPKCAPCTIRSSLKRAPSKVSRAFMETSVVPIFLLSSLTLSAQPPPSPGFPPEYFHDTPSPSTHMHTHFPVTTSSGFYSNKAKGNMV